MTDIAVDTGWKWTDERVVELRAHFADGLSASEIAVELRATHKATLTREAVCGKLFRLGLQRGRRPLKPDKEAAPRTRQRRRQRGLAVSPSGSPAPKPAPAPTRGPPKAIWKPCSIFDLTNDRCRWSCACDVGSPTFHFCGGTGADMAGGKPYCDAHMRCAYRRPGEREEAA